VSWAPTGNKILVRRLEGHGIETVTKGGIILPATREKSVRTKADFFRARVEALGPEAARLMPDLAPGEDVLVYTYSGTAESVFTGTDAKGAGLFIEPDDVLCVVEGES
jgi:co-chaperonin GroES (HSP10)